jgi:hypothetical protein
METLPPSMSSHTLMGLHGLLQGELFLLPINGSLFLQRSQISRKRIPQISPF